MKTNTLHSKFTTLNIVKSVVVALLILSCIPLIGCSKSDETKIDEEETDKVVILRQWLKDKDRSVRQMAAEQLGEMKETSAVNPLITALKDSNRSV